MSFEAFVHCLRDGEVAGVSRQQVRDAFGSFLTEGGAYDWQLYYGAADNCDVILSVDNADKNLLHSFTVLRPCGDERFWDAMASILRLGNLVGRAARTGTPAWAPISQRFQRTSSLSAR